MPILPNNKTGKKMPSIGWHVGVIRKRLGLSQKELGLILGVSTNTLGRWERGEHIPTIPHLLKLVKIHNDKFPNNNKKISEILDEDET